MSNMAMRIEFSTNAKQVQAQIEKLSHATAKLSQQAKFARALDTNKASARELTGQLSGRKAILKLEQQIAFEANRRMKTVASGYRFGNKEQDQYIRGLIKQNEVMRIRTKILNDNATAMVNLGKNTQWAGRQLVVGFTVPLTIAAGAAMMAFSNLEKEMVRFKRVYGDVTTTGPELKEMAKQVRALAVEWTKYGVAVSDTVQMAADAAGAGFKGDQLITQINSATKLAVLGELEKQKAMKATIALQSTFAMSNEELGQSINYLNQLENSTMVTMDDMATAIPKAATVVQGLGGNIKDLGTFMAALQEGGVTAAEGANALKSGLGSLLNPSKKANEQLAGIGVNMDNLWAASEKNGRGVISVVEELATALDRLGQTQKQQVVEELFGKHQFARMNALLSNINTGTQAKQAKDVAGTGQLEQALVAQQELAKLGESSLTKFQASIEKLKSAIAPLGEQIMQLVTPLVEFATKLIDKFNSMPDLFKQISVGIVAALGVVAPLLLMLLGQFQNLLGNGMKFTNWIRSWGKNVKWVSIENLTLADTLGGVNAQLVAENALLQTNTSSWRNRGAAAAGSAGTKPATLGGRLLRRNSGGSIPGTGNTDTVPALLTPGEFVVRKSVAEKFRGTLSAMNSGRLQGFAGGAPMGVKPLPAKAQAAKDKVGSLTPAQTKMEKARAYATLMKFKAYENNVIAKIHHNFVAKFPQFTFAGVRNWQQWDQSHIGRADKNKIYNSDLDKKQKLWNYQGDLILDNHMININLPSKNDHPVTPGEVTPFREKILGKLKGSKINPNHLITDAVLNFRQRAAGADFYNQYMDDNFIFMNLIGGKKGTANTIKSAPSGKWSVNAGKEIKGIEMNTGGWVPGTGNRDTVPAVLTPGEAVIKKSAAAKFRPVLNAMNNGSLGMFSKGKTDAGYRGSKTSSERYAMLDPARAEMETFLAEFQKTFNIGKKKMKKVRAEVEANFRDQTASSHIVPARDSLGKKVYDDRNLVAATKRENQAMLDMGKEQNQGVLQRVAKETAKSAEHLAARNAVLDKLAKGEHIIVKEERKLLQEIMVETEQLRSSKPAGSGYDMSKTLTGSKGMAVAAGLSSTSVLYASGKPVTADDEATARKVAKEANPKGGKAAEVGRTGSRFDPYALMMMLTMFGGELSGVTDKLGNFGNMLNMAMPALMTMQMMGLAPNMQLKGMIGKGTGAVGAKNALMSAGLANGGLKGRAASAGYGVASKFGKFGLGAGAGFGALGAIGGGYLGSKIGDGQGGKRDAAGSAVSWGATGAGLGMMLGPWGAVIGGVIGGLAGFTLSLAKSKKELDKSVKSMEKASMAWEDMGKQLSEKYQIGGNVDMKTWLTDVTGLNKKQAEMFELLRKDMKEAGGPWAARISDLTTAASKGITNSDTLQAELTGMTMQLRGQGVDDQSIETILKAFVSELPEAVTKGFNASDVVVKTTAQAIADVQANVATVAAYSNALPAAAKQANVSGNGEFALAAAGLGGSSGNGWSVMLADKLKEVFGVGGGTGSARGMSTEELKKLTPVVTNATNAVSTGMSSLTQTLINAEVGTKEYEQAQDDLNMVTEEAKKLNDSLMGTAAQDSYLRTAGAGVSKMISSGEGGGLDQTEWDAKLKEDGANAVLLNEAAEKLIIAGYDLSAFSAVQITAMGAALTAQQTAVNANNAAVAAEKETQAGLKEIAAAGIDRAAEMKKQGHAIKAENVQNQLDKLNTRLEIDRITMETNVVERFAKQFSKAFGASVDSFADAQYQIDKIGQKIQSINLKVIGPLQEKADDLRRLNDLDSRKIDKLQKKAAKWDEAQQKRVKKLTDAYDAQAKALERVRQQNEYIANAQRANISLADALSKGDLAGAANAMVDSAQNQANYASTLNDQKLADARDAALAAEEKKKNPYTGQIDKIQAGIDARSQKILALEDKIYAIQEKQIEPLQRKSDLMSLMLSNTKLELEYQKANIDGYDQENEARRQSLIQAQEANYQARHLKTIEDGINEVYDNRIKKVAEQFGIQSTNAKIIAAEVAKQDAAHHLAATRSAQVVKDTAADLAEMAAGNNDVIAMWEAKVKKGSTAGVIQEMLDYINGETEKTPTKSNSKQDPTTRSDYRQQVPQAAQKPVKPYTGGAIGGTGGQDSVPALLTPGEYVMRKSAVKRIGLANLERANMGGQESGFGGYYAGGKVANFLGTFGQSVLDKGLNDPKLAKARGVSSQSNASSGYLQGNESSGWQPAGRGASKMADYLSGIMGASRIPMLGLAQVVDKCLTIVGGLYTKFVGSKTAPGANSPILRVGGMRRAGIQFNQGYNAPKGAMYWYGGGRYGHVGISDGRGNVLGNYGGNYIERRPANLNRPYYGWTTKMATGGLVPGSGNLDNVSALLTPGEFVMKKSAVDNIGTGPLRAMNASGSLNYTPSTPIHAPVYQGGNESVVYNDYNMSFAVSGNYDVNQLADIVVRKIERTTSSKVRSRG